MSDWFKNPSSEIPDEMWRAPTPMQRQADAVVMWAELTGKHASFDGVKAFGQTLRLNPRSDDLEKAFAHYEKKTGKGRDQMSQRDIHNSLRATGMGKSAAWKPGVEKAIRMAGDNIKFTGAAIGAPVGGLKAYTDYRAGKGGISKAEATLKGEIAKAQSQKADKKQISKLRQKLQTAKSRRENIGLTTAKGVGIGAGTGALTAYAAKRGRPGAK